MSFKKNKYTVLKNAISPEIAEFVYKYFLNKRNVARFLFDQKYISPFTEYFGVWNDDQVPNTYSHYSDIAMETLLQEVKPDCIFHLASHAKQREGFINPLLMVGGNVMGTANLLEAIRFTKTNPHIMICSTSELYGKVSEENVPITEECPIAPVNPYAVSKLTQDYLGYAYYKSWDLNVIRTRTFGYINPKLYP